MTPAARQRLAHELARLEARAAMLGARRRALPAGSTRSRVAQATAAHGRAIDQRDHLAAVLRAATPHDPARCPDPLGCDVCADARWGVGTWPDRRAA